MQCVWQIPEGVIRCHCCTTFGYMQSHVHAASPSFTLMHGVTVHYGEMPQGCDALCGLRDNWTLIFVTDAAQGDRWIPGDGCQSDGLCCAHIVDNAGRNNALWGKGTYSLSAKRGVRDFAWQGGARMGLQQVPQGSGSVICECIYLTAMFYFA
ncbi:hypothetical protein XELAEV_18024808mg [Xenopus laevis]|uniref:Uncharacterized protein n=1 Tax=Xenopus laevis TaxID=8355 RepID=A0A974CZI6_XENLA|nr:hypothetical protein XELAEV_18024808mg [Xenopus laevis]